MRRTFLSLICLGLLGSLQLYAEPDTILVVNKIKTNGNLPGNLAFVTLSTGKVLTTVPVGKEPHEVVVTDDQKYAVVSNTGSYDQPGNTLSVIDLKSRKKIHQVDLGPLYNPHGLLAMNGLVYFTAEGARTIGAYDPAKNKVVWLNGTGQDSTHTLVAAANGKYIICTNRGSGTISIFELNKVNMMGSAEAKKRGDPIDPLAAGSWTETIIPVGTNPEGITMSPDGTQVWVGLKKGEGIAIVDIAQKKIVDSFKIDGVQQMARLKFSKDGRYVFGTDSFPSGDLIVMDPQTHQMIKKISLGEGAEAIFIEPDGQHILVSVTNQDKVSEVDLNTLTVDRTFSTGKGPDAIALIPSKQ